MGALSQLSQLWLGYNHNLGDDKVRALADACASGGHLPSSTAYAKL